MMGLAFVVTTLVYPYVLAFARKHKIVDNPNARKLQHEPVPVMGGSAVFIGIMVAVLGCYICAPNRAFLRVIALLGVIYAVGFWDDIKDLSAVFRLILDFGVVWLTIVLLGMKIDDFNGLWGLNQIPDAVSIPLSLIAGVGITNAINLIDGIDGYCSSFIMMACACYAVIFFYSGDMMMFGVALIAIGALLPFFFHNVFGKKSKMFMGDGGSLMLGVLLVMFTFRLLSKNSTCAFFVDRGISRTAMALAILAVPVFDTLRVMVSRIVRKQSPFCPDKTHLHHLFLDMNYSHLATSGTIVFCNLLIIILLMVCWKLGAGIDLQNYIVIAAALLFTWGFYFFMDGQHRKNNGEGSAVFKRLSKKEPTAASGAVWQFIRRVVDSRFFGSGFMKDEAVEES